MRNQIIAVFPVTFSKSKDTFSCKEQPDIFFPPKFSVLILGEQLRKSWQSIYGCLIKVGSWVTEQQYSVT